MLVVEILQGNQRKVTATFKVRGVGDPAGDTTNWDLTDPTTVTFARKRLRAADSTIETWTYAAAQITRESLGVYSKILDFDSNGSYRVGSRGTGACKANEEVTVVVNDAETMTP